MYKLLVLQLHERFPINQSIILFFIINSLHLHKNILLHLYSHLVKYSRIVLHLTNQDIKLTSNFSKFLKIPKSNNNFFLVSTKIDCANIVFVLLLKVLKL